MRWGDDEPETAFSRGCVPGALELGEQLPEQVREELLLGLGERGEKPLLVVEMGGSNAFEQRPSLADQRDQGGALGVRVGRAEGQALLDQAVHPHADGAGGKAEFVGQSAL
jgi:hypothetical protein